MIIANLSVLLGNVPLFLLFGLRDIVLKENSDWSIDQKHSLKKHVLCTRYFLFSFGLYLQAIKETKNMSSDMMATYYNLLDEVKDLKLDVSVSQLNSLGVSFAELEKHGFDVEAPKLRINKLLSIQDSHAKMVEEMKCFEKKKEEENIKKRELEEELAEVKLKILELQRRRKLLGKEKKEAVDKNMVELKSNVVMIEQEFE